MAIRATPEVLERLVPGPPRGGLRGGGDHVSGLPLTRTRPEPPVANAKLAMIALIGFETMLFVGLLGGYVVLRWSHVVWPPAGQPYLPIAVTWANTFILLGSCVPLVVAVRARRTSERPGRGTRLLALAAVMGVVFLAVQGTEWARLLAHGMKVQGGIYGGLFVLLIGTHALHVAAAVVWLAAVAFLAATRRIAPGPSVAVDICALYWYFVSALWVVIFTMVYLA